MGWLKYIIMPKNDGQRYYAVHYRFFARLAAAAGIRVEYATMPRANRGFEVRTEGCRILVDFGDHHHTAPDVDEFDACFRYHYSHDRHDAQRRTYPFTPVSFHNWTQFAALRERIRYDARGEFILNAQRPGAAAKQRRAFVQAVLRREYGPMLDTAITDQAGFWKRVGQSLVAVCVPGARNDILDRGQLQLWAFGMCTISPRLEIVLPWWEEPEPGRHYIECADDYSDLIDRIEWCRANRDDCCKVGAEAKALFDRACTPGRVRRWMEYCLSEEETNGEEISRRTTGAA